MRKRILVVILVELFLSGCFSSTKQDSPTNSFLQIEQNGSLIKKDVNGYKTIKIGNQIWMAENLNVDKFRNGDPIVSANSKIEWNNAWTKMAPAWCYYENSKSYENKYGRLYNWYAVNDLRGLAPKGWHIPSDAEWEIMINYLGGNDSAINKLKSNYAWGDGNNGNNLSGFNALPSGYLNEGITFDGIDLVCMFWSSTEGENTNSSFAYARSLDFGHRAYVVRERRLKGAGLSIRCIRD